MRAEGAEAVGTGFGGVGVDVGGATVGDAFGAGSVGVATTVEVDASFPAVGDAEIGETGTEAGAVPQPAITAAISADIKLIGSALLAFIG